MPWFKVDDSFRDHPKVLALSDTQRLAAVGMWTLAGDWSAKHGTDGLVPHRVCGTDARSARKLCGFAAELVRVRLWHETSHECGKCAEVPEGYYLFHDWADYQPTAAKVQAERKKNAEKLAAWRARKAAEGGDVTGNVTRLHPDTG